MSEPGSLPPKIMEDGPPPFLGSWKRVYAVVLLYLAVVIFGLYLFSSFYSL
ncbi:MAG TPA: hypothetical protein VMZ52_03240 [Bryobacteraceae bacterium]|nr:hypothetical protein [Bryobacteraceae bacterium]